MSRDGSTTIQRRVSARKRTPSYKARCAVAENPANDRRRSSKPPSPPDGGDEEGDIASWIENSFFSSGTDVSRRKVVGGPTNRGRVSRTTPAKTQSRGNRSSHESDAQEMIDSQSLVGCDSENGSIFSGLVASTPKKIPLTQSSQMLMPSTLDPDYCTQHDSFNDSDPALEGIDLLDMTTESPANGRKRKSKTAPGSTGKHRTGGRRGRRRRASVGGLLADSTVINADKTGAFFDGSFTQQDPNTSAVSGGGDRTRGEFDSDDSLFGAIELGNTPANALCNVRTCGPTGPDVTDQKVSSSMGNVQLNNFDNLPNAIVSNIPSNAATPSVPAKSFRERLKNRLLENAKTPPPAQGIRFQERVRQEMVEQALKEVEELKQRLGNKEDSHEGTFYGLSEHIKGLFKKLRGISKVYDWQHECLSLPSIQDRKNLIYSLPTSGGKTLVAEILILKELLVTQRDAVLILPFVSIVQEKVRGLTPFAVDLDFLVEEYAASKGQFPPKKRHKKKSVFICTMEKAHSLINSLIENKRLDSVGLVVVDELHMLGEGGSRGAILEMTLTKVMHAAKSTQIIGMSATLNNIGDLQQFLRAEVYTSNFRPVKLREYVKLQDTIYEVNNDTLCPEEKLIHDRVITFKYDAAKRSHDPDHIAGLVQEVIPDHSCLVFCATKKNCENVAELVCKLMSIEMLNVKCAERRALIQALLFDGNGQMCPVLERTIPYGVAYHHSGLTMDERRLIEEAYSEGTLCMLACTSTLAAGVNLPAKRVILRSPYIGLSFLSRSQYKQMTGRAGRAGIDSSGESILILQGKDKKKVMDIVGGPVESCRSSLLYENKKGIRSLLLTTIGLQITDTTNSVCQFLQKTLCNIQSGLLDQGLMSMAREGLQNLIDLGLITQKRSRSQESCSSPDGSTHTLEVTSLGRAVFKGPIDIDLGQRLYKDLVRAQESLVVANHLHILYLVTPYDMTNQVHPNWMLYLNELGCLDTAELKVASLIGVSEGYVAKRISGQRSRRPVDETVVRRFYLTLILYDLWKQRSLWEVSRKYNMGRGFIQQLLNSAAAFAACVGHFCQELEEFWAYQELLINFVKRLSYCVTMELVPLMEIPGVKIGRARQLFNAGFKTLQLVAYAEPEQLVQAIQHLPRKTAKQIVAAAQMLLQERAESLLEEADDLIAMPTEPSDETEA